MRLKSRLDKIYYFTFGVLTVDALAEKESQWEDDFLTKYFREPTSQGSIKRRINLSLESKKLYRQKAMLAEALAVHFSKE